MKNVFVANLQCNGKLSFEGLEKYIRSQIDNAFNMGWSKEDIWPITNFEYSYRGVNALVFPLNTFCLTGSKIFAIRELFRRKYIKDDMVVWTHDLDVWQNAPFECPEFKDVGICTYSRPKFNGGTVFYKKEAHDLVEAVAELLEKDKRPREEPTINELWKSDKYKDRVTTLNNTYNVGCSGYAVRYERSEKPLKGVHFHPTNRIAWDTHARNRNGISTEAAISGDLRKLLKKYFGDVIGKFKYEDMDERGPYDIRPNGIDRKKAEKMRL